ncbi:MAG: hypothetical protein KDC18_01800 [Alphaproteobacteria bacterium]|nr:hypothetical protein [Alphaproteobacteria bacterium]MCB9930431.1 hypothetical protein [Alphaproteobacteria bacterium]
MTAAAVRTEAPTIPAQVRYVNAEWKGRPDSPRIGSRETRRANTAFQDVRMHNARPMLAAGECTLDVCGFTLTHLEPGIRDFRDDEEVQRTYYPAIERLVERTAGAHRAFVRSHLIRTETPIDFNDGYARFVHCDYNVKRLREMSEAVLEQHGVEPNPNWDYVWYNTWQPFDYPAIRNPMAFIDWRSLPADDVIDYYYTGRNTDSLVAAPVYNPDHNWCYFPDMTPDEILVFKQMDGRPDVSVYCPHTSFEVKDLPEDTPPRRSIEMRLLAVFER